MPRATERARAVRHGPAPALEPGPFKEDGE